MDGITRSPTLGGVVLAAAASAGSAVYKVKFLIIKDVLTPCLIECHQVSFKRIFGEATYGQVSFFFSLIGLLNIILLWPVVLMLHFTGLEVITWNRVPWVPLAIAGSLSLGLAILFYYLDFCLTKMTFSFIYMEHSGQLTGQLWTGSNLRSLYSPWTRASNSRLCRWNFHFKMFYFLESGESVTV